MRENRRNEREVEKVCSCDCRREEEQTLLFRILLSILIAERFPKEEDAEEGEGGEEEMPREHLTHHLPLRNERSGGIRFFEVVEVHHSEEIPSREEEKDEVEDYCGKCKTTGESRKPLFVPPKLKNGECKKWEKNMNPRALCNTERDPGEKLLTPEEEENAKE